MPVPSSKHINVTASWTPTAGSLTALRGVQGADIGRRPQVVTHSGDANIYDTLKAVVGEDPMATVRFRDLAFASALNIGDRGTLTVTFLDAKNKASAGGGALIATLANAIVTDVPIGGQHRQLSEHSVQFESESTDGLTNPLSWAAA